MKTIAQRLSKWTHITDGCHLWVGYKNQYGYGRIMHEGESRFAHRVSFCVHHGIPLTTIDKLVVWHLCDSPGCVNPNHLCVGNHADNMHDMSSKGRHRNQKKQCCKNGHQLAGKNLVVYAGNRRGCKTCRRNFAKEFARRKRGYYDK